MVIATEIKPGENLTDEIFYYQKNSQSTVLREDMGQLLKPGAEWNGANCSITCGLLAKSLI